MREPNPHLKIDPALVTNVLVKFLQQAVGKTGFRNVVVGVSGGIDSAVVAALCARAFEPENVYGVFMPYRTSNPESLEHGKMIAEQLGINGETVDISKMVDAFFENDEEADEIRRGNRMARERMCVLYDLSVKYKALVIGTSNKTELMLGYGTIFGDLASAVNPIGDLYKSQIWHLAEHLGIPEVIINKPPSADLWDGQTDEEELGYSYATVDDLLYYLVDQRYSREMLLQMDFPVAMIDDVQKRIRIFQFKRRPPVIAKLSNRTINQDFRYCRDWGA